MKKSIYLALALLVFSVGAPAFAAEVRVGERVTISQNEVISENVYAAGGQTALSGTLNGDVVVAGGEVVVNGQVVGDAALVGGSIGVFETVNGDVRSLGGQVTIGKSVTGDVVVVGGSVSILPDVVVGGDLLIVGGELNMDGTVNGDARIVAGELRLGGLIAGDVDARIGTITFEDEGAIGGTLTYRATKAADIPENAVGGEVMFTQVERTGPEVAAAPFAGVGIGFIIVQLLVFAVATVVMVLVFPKLTHEVGVATTTKQAWKYAGVGFATLILLPVAALVLFMSVLGAFVGGMVLIGFVALLAIAKAMTGITVGAYLSRWTKKEAETTWKWALVGVVVIELLALVPFFGWLLLFVFFIITLGAITLGFYRRVKAEHKKA